MKGYNNPQIEWGPIQNETVLVGCRGCRFTWYEVRGMLKNGPRINGPMYDYDYCDKCKPQKPTAQGEGTDHE
jgi:hypothetical protein